MSHNTKSKMDPIASGIRVRDLIAFAALSPFGLAESAPAASEARRGGISPKGKRSVHSM